ncbi:MAG: Crp/Fnr family transcriptional regulator [Thermoflexibacter sp.]|jgi:CRP-like cAMP-binding protein|nr:Crp/Fnr family transcriptional regulator [Thermoflexibacter sp.]
MHNQLLNLISQNTPITEFDKNLCVQYFEPVLYPKNRVVEPEGKIPRYLYFIVSGFMRLFYYNDSGEEVTTHINCPPGFLTSYSDFIDGKISSENVECVTECELLRITKKDLDTITQESIPLKNFSIWVFQQSLSYNESRSKDLANLTAEQRYKKLLETNPQILHNVPLQYIASFLGMNAKSLSRIRRQIIK